LRDEVKNVSDRNTDSVEDVRVPAGAISSTDSPYSASELNNESTHKLFQNV
jgi:hypothetical protein